MHLHRQIWAVYYSWLLPISIYVYRVTLTTMFFFIPISYSTPICILYILGQWHKFCMVLSPFSNINANKPTISLPRHFGSFQFLFMFSLTEQSSLMKCHLLGRIPLRQCQSFLIINPMQNEDMLCTFMYCIPPGFLVVGLLIIKGSCRMIIPCTLPESPMICTSMWRAPVPWRHLGRSHARKP